ncbi:MAG: tRNA epoxyqueuosine(34) reductase QueG [Planctomycetales bacterium]|nr:tRNA epoxyqueuosine(34) reductase QueG [Planctomycetales bacterium]
MTLESDIKQKAIALGFDAVGITAAEPVDSRQIVYFRRWLEAGCAAAMDYMQRNIDKRFSPAKLLPGAKSVICVALNYRPESSRSFQLRKGKLEDSPALKIAHFAQYEDYHPFIKERLFQLADYIHLQSINPDITFKACADSAPLAERALAQRAGLGFIGKNRMLIHPELGCQILLGELVTTLELTPDAPLDNQSCGDCGKCLRACPTGALAPDGSFDARKCISYLTIEPGNEGVAPAIKNMCDRDGCVPRYIFGCDECILACPHEINAPPRKNVDFHFHPEWQNLTPEQISEMTEEEFARIFADSGFLRLGLSRLKRNARTNRKSGY